MCLFIYRERGRETEKETLMCEINTDWLTLRHAQTGDWAHHSGMGPDPELNLQHFALWDDAQPSELHWSGQFYAF